MRQKFCARIKLPSLVNSTTPITDAKLESLTSVINSLPSAGITTRNAWGNTICRVICMLVRPKTRPASICPLPIDLMPARIIWLTYAALLSPIATRLPKMRAKRCQVAAIHKMQSNLNKHRCAANDGNIEGGKPAGKARFGCLRNAKQCAADYAN